MDIVVVLYVYYLKFFYLLRYFRTRNKIHAHKNSERKEVKLSTPKIVKPRDPNIFSRYVCIFGSFSIIRIKRIKGRKIKIICVLNKFN